MAAGSSQVECSAALNVFSQDGGVVGQQCGHAVFPAEQGLTRKKRDLVRRTNNNNK